MFLEKGQLEKFFIDSERCSKIGESEKWGTHHWFGGWTPLTE